MFITVKTTTQVPDDECHFPTRLFTYDGICDDDANYYGCAFDGGDCCDKSASHLTCNKCLCLHDHGICPGDQAHDVMAIRDSIGHGK